MTFDDSATATVERLLGHFSADVPTPRARVRYRLARGERDDHLLLRGERTLAHAATWEGLADVLVGAINHEALEGFEGFAVHAGVVATGTSAIAFPAASGAGKSTLTAACLTRGALYVSDEALCVDYNSTGVVSYSKPLSLSPLSRHLTGLAAPVGGGTLMTASEIGADVVDGPLRLRHLVELARTGGHPRLVPLSRSRGMAALLRFSFNHYKRPREAFAVADRLANELSAWRLEYGLPGPASELLLSELSEDNECSGAPET